MEIVIIIGLILLNGLLSMSEIALVSARKSKLETEAKKGNRSAATALKLANEPDRFFSTIQIGITLIGILTGLYSGEAFAGDLAAVLQGIPAIAPYAMIISKTVIVVVVTYFTLVFGELIPKRLGMNKAEKISSSVARPMVFLSRLALPFVWFLSKSTSFIMKLFGLDKVEENKVTEEEIKAIVKEGMNYGEVQEVEHDLVARVFNLGDRDICSIMTHRSEVVWLDIKDSIEQIRMKVGENLFDTYPVASNHMENIIGVVSLKNMFGRIDDTSFSLAEQVKPALFMPENQSVYSALELFKVRHTKFGVISNEFGDILGIVTLTDIMEALVGEVQEQGEEQEIIRREDGSVLVDGQCSFYDFLEYFDREDLYAKNDYNTLSGLILEELEHIPATGEKFAWENFEFEIVDMDGVRIDKVIVNVKN